MLCNSKTSASKGEVLKNHGWTGTWALLLALLFAASAILRLTFLDQIPGAPYIDESALAANAMCLAQQGTSAYGDRWPLFVEVLVGNWEPPMIAYPSALIAWLGDGSIGSFRLVPALFAIGTVVGVYLLGRELANNRIALWSALLATLSPASFIAGRLFWKCPLAPFFVVLGVYWFVVAVRQRSNSSLLLSAACFALSLYSYQSAWAQAPLFIAALFTFAWWRDRGFALRGLPLFSAVLAAGVVPLLVLVLSGGFMKRAADVSVFQDGIGIGALRFARNFLFHFDPRFLYFTGDANLRHGVGGFGQLSWLDLVALFAGVWALVRSRARQLKYPELGMLSVIGVLTGVVAAAMSNEGIPHALRANGMWPFFALLGGWLVAQVDRPVLLDRTAIVASALFLALFAHHHFYVYPQTSALYFSDSLGDIARSEDPHRWQRIAREARPVVARYYLMRYGGMRCDQAGAFIAHSRMETQ